MNPRRPIDMARVFDVCPECGTPYPSSKVCPCSGVAEAPFRPPPLPPSEGPAVRHRAVFYLVGVSLGLGALGVTLLTLFA